MSAFDKLQDVMQEKLAPIADKIAGNTIMQSISGGFSMVLPIIMVGAIASLLSGLGIEAYQNFVTSTGLKAIFTYITDYTTNMVSLFAVFGISKTCAERLGMKKEAATVGIISLCMFIMMIPTGVGEGDNFVAGAITTTYFGSSGLFTAMIMGIIIPYIYNIFVKKNITIKLPDSVPPIVSNSFAALIPAFAITAVFVLIRFVCTLTPYGTLNDMIYGILRAPLASLSESPFTFYLLLLMCNILWFFGIHGGMVVMPFLTMLYMPAGLENLDAFAAGLPLPNMITKSWWFCCAQLGGSGACMGLAIDMILFAKSEQFKTISKIAIVPAICSISEPMVFGVPLMMNPTMLIPMLLSPTVCFLSTYLLTAMHILPYLNGVEASTGTPVILSGFMCGGWKIALWQVVLLLLQMAIYLPFFKMLDKKALIDQENDIEETELDMAA